MELYWNGLDLRREPLLERKAKLPPLIENSNILFSEHFDTDGATMLERACAMGLEGIISKVRDSRYESDRSSDWYRIRAVPQGLRKLGYSKFNLGQSGLNTDTTTRYLPNRPSTNQNRPLHAPAELYDLSPVDVFTPSQKE